MISITCDNCERVFEVDDEQAGGKVPCPMCGDINRVPESAGAADDGLPPDSGPEKHICTIRPAMARAHPFRALLIFILFAGGIAVAIWLRERTWLVYPCLAISLFALIWAAIWWVSTHMWVQLRISNKRSVHEVGIIRRSTSEVLHDHVLNVQIDQSFLARILGTGTIRIDSAAGYGDQAEIQVRDVPKPYEIKNLIDRYRNM
jgi:predicted Zn finger-like uncharacterized protein